MDNIIYTTPAQQLEKLKEQHLIIENDSDAKNKLSACGYSNLIKSYRDPYTIITNDGKIYRSGVTFNQIYSLYMLDKELRNAVMASMLDLEEHIKEAAADVIANNFGTHPDDYLKFSNYANKQKRKRRFTLAGILEKMNETLSTDKDPIHHYQEVHGIVPPWILFKSIYFSTMINFIDQFKPDQKKELVYRLYDFPNLNIPINNARMLMMDTLFICLEYRNTAAHGGRTYNYKSNHTLRATEILGSDLNVSMDGFSQLLFLLDLLNYQNPFINLENVLSREVDRHCKNFPQDVTYLAQILNLNIQQRYTVYISKSSRKFHSNPHCSGLISSYKMDIDEAIKNGYVPCKRCNK